MSASLTELITGIISISSTFLGIWLLLREIKSRQRKEIDRLDNALSDTWDELVEYHTYSSKLRIMLADQGLNVPDPPQRHVGPNGPNK